jgi:hypothetical protein
MSAHMRNLARRGLTAITMIAALALAVPEGAGASPLDRSGVIRLARPAPGQLNATQSGNWFGYGAGALERGTVFNSISGAWTVPAASVHSAGHPGDSATWVGIGGGCIEPGCVLSDSTLVQAGTEQDVDSSGHPSYWAWWELVPGPAVTIGSINVSPGDRIEASIGEVVPNSELWTITLKDVSNGENFSTTVPYSSTQSTAEWIDEAPISIGANGVGETTLPQLTETRFTGATVNGAPARLNPGEEIQLVDTSGAVIGAPSAPDGSATAFTDCTWASACSGASTGAPPAPARSTSQPRRHRRHRAKAHHRRSHRHRRARRRR